MNTTNVADAHAEMIAATTKWYLCHDELRKATSRLVEATTKYTLAKDAHEKSL